MTHGDRVRGWDMGLTTRVSDRVVRDCEGRSGHRSGSEFNQRFSNCRSAELIDGERVAREE